MKQKKSAPNPKKNKAPKRHDRDSARPKAASGQPRPQRSEKAPAREPLIKPVTKSSLFFYGRHAIEAALKNGERKVYRLLGLKRALDQNDSLLSLRPKLPVAVVQDEKYLRSLVPADAPHQGLVLECEPLADAHLDGLTPIPGERNIIIMLDQVTDPHNIGACLRAGAALGARALITPDRNSPLENGTIARTAAGALESLPWVRVTNLVQSLEQLKELGYWSVGMDGDTDQSLKDVSLGDNLVIVMGSEGKGMRDLTRKHCDMIAKIPMTGMVESLNVATAAAIAVYELGGVK